MTTDEKTYYAMCTNVPGYMSEADFPWVADDFEEARSELLRQMGEDRDAETDRTPNIDHHPSGVSYCNDCGNRLVLMSDDDGEGGEIRDVHDCFAEHRAAFEEALTEIRGWEPGDNATTVTNPYREHDLGRAYSIQTISASDYAEALAYLETFG